MTVLEPRRPPAAGAPSEPEPEPARLPGVALFVGGAGWMFVLGATAAVLLPARLAELAPEDKVRLLTVATVAGAVLSLVANVVFGACSDRTRSRFGRRNPWVLGAGLACAPSLVLLSLAGSVTAVVAAWCLVMLCVNAHVAALVATIPDRVPVTRRGTASALYGAGMILGQAGGQVTAAAFLGSVRLGLQVVGVAVVLTSVLFVTLAPEPAATTRRPGAGVLAMVAFPRHAPDFVWALVGRLLLVTAYYSVAAYLLYILTDYLGLSTGDAGRAVVAVSLAAAVAALVGAAVAGPLSDRSGRRKAPVVLSSVLIGVAVLVPFAWASVGGVVLTAALAGLGFGVYLSVDAALMTEVLPSSADRAKDLGILNIANTGGQVIAPVVASLTVGIGGYRPLFVVAAAIAVGSALCIRPIRSVR